ncbi:MAG: DUF1800 domain-containing protein [Acidobacteriia bacterium]|nr:DUF1800 domain-containing protein [Terriglobia bacterium]
MRGRAAVVLVISLFVSALTGAAASKTRHARRDAHLFQEQIPAEQRIDQALNRLTFGPRPGEAEQVKSTGLKKWIDLQLHPDRMRENPVVAEKLKALDSLAMSSRDLVQNFPAPQMARQMVNGTLPFPADPNRRILIRKLAARPQGEQTQRPDLARLFTPQQLRELRTGTPEQRLAALQAFPPDQQEELIADLPPNVLQGLIPLAPPALRRKLELAAGPQQVVVRDLAEGKLLRAIYSNRQLEEVLVDFWYNHFNVFLDKGADRYLVTAYERDVIRPRVLGKFRDLLEATAKSPAMLFYLDNWQSVGVSAPQAGRGVAVRRGLNENYGRELLELHTLGVDGGYTQKDVTEVARCFTGWTIRQPQQGGEFFFNPRMHDRGAKKVLGVTIPAGGGMEDGEKVLDILARNPATAHFISRKLAMRFVADDPPPALVDRMAKTFLKTNGDLRAVMKTMTDSKEFWSVGAYRSKMKSPLEMVASAVRAVNGEVNSAIGLDNQVAQLGEPLYRKLEPTGYSNSGEEWINSAGLLARMNFALNLANNRVAGVKIDAAPTAQPGAPIAGISLGAPEFQRH